MTIVGCGSTLWLARIEGHPTRRATNADTEAANFGSEKLMSALGAEGLTNEAKMRRNVFPGPYRDSVSGPPIEALPQELVVI